MYAETRSSCNIQYSYIIPSLKENFSSPKLGPSNILAYSRVLARTRAYSRTSAYSRTRVLAQCPL